LELFCYEVECCLWTLLFSLLLLLLLFLLLSAVEEIHFVLNVYYINAFLTVLHIDVKSLYLVWGRLFLPSSVSFGKLLCIIVEWPKPDIWYSANTTFAIVNSHFVIFISFFLFVLTSLETELIWFLSHINTSSFLKYLEHF